MRVCFVGCGLIGNKRARLLPQHAIITGCHDQDAQRSIQFAKTFNTKSFSSLQELLDKSSAEVMVVATTHESLASTAKLGLKHGMHVLVEKPGGITPLELKELKLLSRELNRLVHVGYNHRFHPAIRKAHDLFSQGYIGSLMYIRAKYGHGGRLGYESEWRANKGISGGGELIDQGSHLLDLSLYFMGSLKLGYALTPTFFWNMSTEDNAFLVLQNMEKRVAFLHASWTEWKNLFNFEIFGNLGKIEVSGLGRSYGTETLSIYKMSSEMGPPREEHYEFNNSEDSWSNEMNCFLTDIQESNFKSSNLDSSIEILEIVDEAYKGAQK